MTVVAWDGTTLAADKRATNNGLHRTVRKIYRLNDEELAGVAGDFADSEAILAWLRGSRNPDTFPQLPDRDSARVLVLRRIAGGVRVLLYEARAIPIEFEERHFAMGCGRDYAMAALYLGKSAVEAVAIASALDCYCGNGIDTLTFDTP